MVVANAQPASKAVRAPMELNYILAQRPAGQGAQHPAGARHEHSLLSAFEGEPGMASPTLIEPRILLRQPEQLGTRAKLGLPPTSRPEPKVLDVIQAARLAEQELYLYREEDLAHRDLRRIIREPQQRCGITRVQPREPLAALRAQVCTPPGLDNQLPLFAAMVPIRSEDPVLTEPEWGARQRRRPAPTSPEPHRVYQLTLLMIDHDISGQLVVLLQENQQPPRGVFDMAKSYPEALSVLLAETGHAMPAKTVPTLLPACFIADESTHYFAVVQRRNVESTAGVPADEDERQTPLHLPVVHPHTPGPMAYYSVRSTPTRRPALWTVVLSRLLHESMDVYYSGEAPWQRSRRNQHVPANPILGSRFCLPDPQHVRAEHSPNTEHVSRVYRAFVEQVPGVKKLPNSIVRPLWLPTQLDNTAHPDPEPTPELRCDPEGAEEALFDTGATRDYINPEVVQRHQLRTRSCRVLVTVADSTQSYATQEAWVSAVAVDPEGKPTVIAAWMLVFDIPHDIILGLPTLIGRMGQCFLSHLQALVRQVADQPEGLHAVATQSPQELEEPTGPEEEVPDPEFRARHDARYLVQAWTRRLEEAPEDTSTPLPSDWSEALHFMEMTVEQAEQEYLAKYKSRLGPAVADDQEVDDIMRTLGAKVFVPQSWDGIKGVIFKINWRPDMPRFKKPRARPVNPALYDHVKREYERLASYMYVPTDGPYASPLVVAPKATAPFIRLCGDYREINKWVEASQYPIPDIKKMLARLQGKRFYIDLDLSNAFHQIALDRDSSERLALQFPWGQMRPLFLPEGVKPASHQLQRVVMDIFDPISADTLIAFDNLLIMADSLDQAKVLLRRALQLCIDRNVYLKLSKSNIIVSQVDFFGYTVSPEGIRMQASKVAEIDAIPFPTNLARARSFIGSTVYYTNFIPHYATLMAPLQAMVTANFNWRDETKLEELKVHFEAYKTALKEQMSLTYPDYSLPWTLRTDASTYGVGAVLFQTRTLEDGSLRHEPLYFLSHKFSDPATRWSTIEQEAYAIFYALQQLDYYLWRKPLVVETDHANLVWIEQSIVPKVVRWRLYMQSFNLMVRHIPGKANRTADYLSRLHIPLDQEHLLPLAHELMQAAQHAETEPEWGATYDPRYSLPYTAMLNCLNALERCLPARPERRGRKRRNEDGDDDDDDDEHGRAPGKPNPAIPAEIPVPPEEPADCQHPDPDHPVEPETPALLSDEQMLDSLHNARQGHMGVARTWAKLKDLYPGHSIPYAYVAQYVESCPLCQKFRLDRGRMYYKPQVRKLPADYLHHSIGIDHLYMVPDEAGNKYLLVVVNLFSKLTHLYPVPNKDEDTTARCLLRYFSQYGLADTVRCDQGSDYTGAVVRELHNYLGIPVHYGLVRRHESSGVERTNREVRRHIVALMAEDALYDSWSSDAVLPVVQFVMNSAVNGETNESPFLLHYGSAAEKYHAFPVASANIQGEFLRTFDAHMQVVQARALLFHDKVQQERLAANDGPLTVYKEGDLILYDNRLLGIGRSKVNDSLWAGPYRVDSQTDNDIMCTHVGLQTPHVLHANDVKLFAGSLAQAQRVARYDGKQHVLVEVRAHKGPHHTGQRQALSFELLYEDGDVVWRPYDTDLQTTAAFQEYVKSRPYLAHLAEMGLNGQRLWDALADKPYPANLAAGQRFYLDLRAFAGYYDNLELPDLFSRPHVTSVIVRAARAGNAVPWIVEVPVFGKARNPYRLPAPPRWWHLHIYTNLPDKAVIVDADFCARYPQLLTDTGRLNRIAHCSQSVSFR